MTDYASFPHTRPCAVWETWKNARGKLAETIRTNNAAGCAVGLLGVPDDTGVRRNNGVPGAAQGPCAFREALGRYGTDEPEGWQWPAVFDAGDIVPGTILGETHRRVTEAAGAMIDAGLFPVAVGGGHDITFPFVRAASMRCTQPMRGIYLDAHLDVREEDGSGMPFRKLIEECGVKGLDVIGLDAMANTKEHVRWFTAHGGRVDAIDAGDQWPGDGVFVSIDLDAIDASQAPGVSARNPDGLSARTAAAWAYQAGRRKTVRCFDIMELSPPNDDKGRTARLAAHLFCHFLRGFAQRNAGEPCTK